MFNPSAFRRQFPLLQSLQKGQNIIYLDSAATSQKPQVVIDALQSFYTTMNANPNRGVHPLAEQASILLQEARVVTQHFLRARSPQEIVFVRSSTEGINTIARTWGDREVTSKDTIVLTTMEHHANIIPWMQLRERTGCTIVWLDVDAGGSLDLSALDAILATHSVKLVACTGLSNVLGLRPPLEHITQRAKAAGARVLIDAAQLIVHEPIDLQVLQPDFLVFSGHKIFAPMGVGVLYIREEIFHKLPPFLGGGDMIETVTKDGFTPAEVPRRFEAGTLPLGDIHGLRVALEWLSTFDRSQMRTHEQSLIQHACSALRSRSDTTMYGSEQSSGCLSFAIEGVHPHDLTDVLGRAGICLRAGHHCAQILHRALGVQATTRLSIAPYTLQEDIDAFLHELPRVISLLQK